MAAVMISIFAVAANLTIVNVALPRIVADLGGLDLFAWPVTAYLLASTAPMPLAGKLGDVFGRKPLIVVGIVIFIGGTAITGLASSMEQLIVFRAVQGVGGGLIMAAVVLSAIALNRAVTTVVLVYFLMTLAYSLALKKRVLLDVIIVAMGFVLRAWAGALAVEVPTSAWLVACVFTLCLFMGFGKRRCELAMIANSSRCRANRG